jgi:hypothetical protein
MTDFRSLYGKEHLGAWDLTRPATLTIAKVTQGELRTPDSRKVDKRPIVHFERTPKTLVLNATNGKTIAAMYGAQVEAWTGKRITVFATTTAFGGRTVECIRVQPTKPPAKGGNALPEEAPPETVIDEPVHDVAPEITGGSDDGSVPGL